MSGSLGFLKRSSNLGVNRLYNVAVNGPFRLNLGLGGQPNIPGSTVLYGGYEINALSFLPLYLYKNKDFYESFKIYGVEARI